MRPNRIFGLTLLSVAMATGGFAAGVSEGGAASATSSGSAATSGASTDNSGIVTTPATRSSGNLGSNTAPHTEPNIRQDDFNTSPRELPSPVDAGGNGVTNGASGTTGTGSVLPSAPAANDASQNGTGADVVGGSVIQADRDASHVPNGTAGSRVPDNNSTAR